jgi:hypothetical protein
MPEMSDDGVLEYIVQEVEEIGIGPNVTIIIGGLVAVGVLNVRDYTMITCPVYLISFLQHHALLRQRLVILTEG